MNAVKNEPQTPMRGLNQQATVNTPKPNTASKTPNTTGNVKQGFTPQNKMANGTNPRPNTGAKGKPNAINQSQQQATPANQSTGQSQSNNSIKGKVKPASANNMPKQKQPHQQQNQNNSSGASSSLNSTSNNAPNHSSRNNESFGNKSNEDSSNAGNNSHSRDGGNAAASNSAPRSHFGQFKVSLGQPTLELPPMDLAEKKFTGRCRIFVANLPANVTDDQVRKLFEEYGQVSEVYLGKANFGFVKMDTRRNAELARTHLDARTYEGRVLRVRLAAHAAAIRVKNLSPYVTNELLEYAFSYFGEVERAIVISDDRGRSIGEGIVEFSRKFSATNALKRCTTDCFLLTGSPKPVYVESFEQRDEEEGFPEKQLNKNAAEFRQEREVGPRFAEPGSFEHEYASRWKQLYELEKQKREALENEIQEARKMLQEQHEYARVEHQTKLLRNQLREMEDRADKFAQLRNTRLDEERRREEERQNQLMYMRQQEEQIIRRQQVQDFGSLRRQENDLRSKASALQDLLEKVRVLSFNVARLEGLSSWSTFEHTVEGSTPTRSSDEENYRLIINDDKYWLYFCLTLAHTNIDSFLLY